MSAEKRVRDPGLAAAVKAAGGVKQLAGLLGVTRGTLYQWRMIPVEPTNHVLAIEAKLGLSRYLLRPDIYGVPYRAHPYVATHAESTAVN